MKISAILTSRNNVENVTNTILSVINNFSNKNQLEILLALDDDDETRFQVIENLKKYDSVNIFVLPRVGYYKISKFLNFLGEKATGNILWLLSDKTLVLTKNWDCIFEKYENKFIVGGHRTIWIDPDDSVIMRQDMLFPIISKMWYNVLGKICDQPHMDSCIDWTVQNFNYLGDDAQKMLPKFRFDIVDIQVEHDRRKSAKIDKIGESDFYLTSSYETRLNDAKKLYEYLRNNPQYIPQS